MAGHNFEDLEIWKRSCRLSVDVFKLIEPLKLYALKDQMARSSLSIASNIAEGAERESEKEFRRFLFIAKASAGELRTQLYIGRKSGYFEEEQAMPFINESREIAAMIKGLANTLDCPS